MIKLIEIINEKRSHSELNPKISVLDSLKPYSDDPNYFVTYTSLEKVGINPNNKFSTPLAIYAYILQDLWIDLIEDNDFFGKNSPYVTLLKLNTDKILDLQKFSQKDFKKNYSILKTQYQKNNLSKSFSEFIKWIKTQSTFYPIDTIGGLFWAILIKVSELDNKNIGKLITKKSTIIANKMLREMGYEVVLDRGSHIHFLQPAQAAFLTRNSYKIIDRFINKTYGKTISDNNEWGTLEQPYFHSGVNPTVDLVIMREINDIKQILLIKRSSKARTEKNKWAIPGGFQDTNSPKGASWKPGRETVKQAAVREIREETGLNLSKYESLIKPIGIFEGGERDPRDNKYAWSKSQAFFIKLPKEFNGDDAKGADDASDAKWFDVNELLNVDLAFDHKKIIKIALKKYGELT